MSLQLTDKTKEAAGSATSDVLLQKLKDQLLGSLIEDVPTVDKGMTL